MSEKNRKTKKVNFIMTIEDYIIAFKYIIILIIGLYFFGFSIINENILSLLLSCSVIFYSCLELYKSIIFIISSIIEDHNTLEDIRNMILIFAKNNPSMFGLTEKDSVDIHPVSFFTDDFINMDDQEEESEDDEEE